MVVMDAATRAGGVAVDDGQARNGHSFTRDDMKYDTLCVAVYGKVLSSWSRNGDGLVDEQLATGQSDRAGHCEVNRVAIVHISERLAQRARAAVVCVGDGNDVGRSVSLSRGSLCKCEWDHAQSQQQKQVSRASHNICFHRLVNLFFQR